MSNEEKCFCCDNTLSGGSEGVSAGVTRYSCPSCGWYCIEDNIRDSLDRDEKFKLACLLCERRLHEKSPVFISSDSSQEAGLDGISSIYRICNKGELLAEFPRPEQLVSRVLLNMNCILEWPYEMIGFKESKYRFCFFVHFGQLKVLFEDLKSRGYINEHYWDVYKSVALTSIAWQKISELEDSAKKSVDSKQCFVAMWFNDAMDYIYNEGIKPAVEEAGYECKRIDKVPHNNKIDDEIIAAINQSKFLVSDFTGQRGGVYFEAGYAKGYGLPVIWTVKKDEVDKLHFDTRQYNHIAYTSAEDLKGQLKNRILATIGSGSS